MESSLSPGDENIGTGPLTERNTATSDASKLCGVCGDKALGNNFNAITCESCKAFFRRNALRPKTFVCPFINECKVDPVTRRFCQKCRLKKCFDIGMKKEWIMSDEEKKAKKAKVEQNRLKRGSSASGPELGELELPPQKAKLMAKARRKVKLEEEEQKAAEAELWEESMSLTPILSSLVNNSPPPGQTALAPAPQPQLATPPNRKHIPFASPHSLPPPPELLEVEPQELLYVDEGESLELDHEPPPLPLNTMESILSVAISAEYNGWGGMLGASSDLTPNNHSPPASGREPRKEELNKAEAGKLSELLYASEALNAPVDQDGPIQIDTCDPSLINVINLTDVAIRRLIKMAKKIAGFKNMCQEDQIALLKGGCTEMMILQSVVNYDPERDSWSIPHSNGLNLNMGVLKEARGNLYEEHQRFVKSFAAPWRSDYNIMIILCAITLFTPQRPNVVHKDVVRLEQDSYYYLLKRYLESTRGGCEARSTYLQLIQRIAELHILNSNHVRVFLEVNPREVEPLLIEIFDLKQ